ncbi:hypothetical protein EGI31_11845 [Lacihabitans soyangensis]|uniref:Uncharacterized protein n=1 Tax=Lacihabitans soyangensis TaxID=869394 RepID=A0AAE3H2X6_9BACT|nr:hypothetical protein [Lacihabitans soyangensis]
MRLFCFYTLTILSLAPDAITETVNASRDLLLGVFRVNTAQNTLPWRSSSPKHTPMHFCVGVCFYIGFKFTNYQNFSSNSKFKAKFETPLFNYIK